MAHDQQSFFISYSRSDYAFVLRLAQDLKAAGASVWLDQLDIALSEIWDVAIEKALTGSSRMLVILSPASVSSHNVMDEVSFALEEKKMVVPILYQQCEIPFRLRRLQRMDFTGDYDAALQTLIERLGLTCSARSVAASQAGPVQPDPQVTSITPSSDAPRSAPVAPVLQSETLVRSEPPQEVGDGRLAPKRSYGLWIATAILFLVWFLSFSLHITASWIHLVLLMAVTMASLAVRNQRRRAR